MHFSGVYGRLYTFLACFKPEYHTESGLGYDSGSNSWFKSGFESDFGSKSRLKYD